MPGTPTHSLDIRVSQKEALHEIFASFAAIVQHETPSDATVGCMSGILTGVQFKKPSWDLQKKLLNQVRVWKETVNR